MGKIICNPLNLEYRYQFRRNGERLSLAREGADPTMLLFKDKYLLFVSMSGGFWYSDDLCSWSFKATPELPIYDYAPDVELVDGRVIFSASSSEACSFYASEDPINVPFEKLTEAFAWWDPHTFMDDDGRLYFYWGCSTGPLLGVEIDRRTLLPIGKQVELIHPKPHSIGWERRPDTEEDAFSDRFSPYIEGAFVNKYKGKYYLQYAAPGTEFNVYGNGVYVSDKPLGPYVMQSNNPFSAVPGGFMTGAGHGSTFRDKEGKWWHVATMRISVNEAFERRVGLFPCDIDEDGILHCNQELATYPFDVETGKRVDWNLLQGRMSASSSQPGHEPQRANDEDCTSWWVCQEEDRNPSLVMDLQEPKTVGAIQVNFADHRLPADKLDKSLLRKMQEDYRYIFVEDQNQGYCLEGSVDGINYEIIRDCSSVGEDGAGDYCHDFCLLEKECTYRFIRLSRFKVPFSGLPAVSGLRVFGKGKGELPMPVKGIVEERISPIDIRLSWEPSQGATGYVVNYGTRPDKLYLSWEVKEPELLVSFINEGYDYYFQVRAFNENGMSDQ